MIQRKQTIFILMIIALASISIRLLMSYQFSHSALLYVGVPFFIALALIGSIKKPKTKLGLIGFYGYISLWSLVIMLATSVILFEGFVCVLMFMPIYFGILLLISIFHVIAESLGKRGKNKHYVQIFPALILLSALEGVVPNFEFERDYSITREVIIQASSEEIRTQLVKPMQLNIERNWLLELFPMPVNIDAESLSKGDVHNIDYVYHRWFVINTHAGSMQLQLNEVEDQYIRTSFLEDTSYIKNYLKLEGTEVHFHPVNNQSTKVSLTIHYERFLDPAWYFGPLQSYAVGEVAELLLNELFTPKEI